MTGVQHKMVGVGFGIAGAYAITHGQGDPYGILVVPAAMVGCMLPDIDHDMTKIGRKRNFITTMISKSVDVAITVGVIGIGLLIALIMVGFSDYGFSPIKLLGLLGGILVVAFIRKTVKNSKTFKWATRHRGIMHTLVVPVLLFLAMNVSNFPLWKYSMLGALIGYVSHLFADMLTVEGCPILFPLTKNNIRFMTLRTKNKSCTYAAMLVAGLAIAVGYVLF